MSGSGISLQAYLVVDNSMLVMLHEYCCDRRAKGLPSTKVISTICEWIECQLDTLKQFTPDGLLHCTGCVANEFKPQAGRLSQVRGIGHREYRSVQNRVCCRLDQSNVDSHDVTFLRGLPAAPSKLVGPNGLSDPDLSLVALGLQLTMHGSPVYVLTNDDDLLSFISWARTKREVRSQWEGVRLLQGLQSLTYFELVHRDCRIQTEQMQDLISFSMVEHYNRSDLAGTRKGTSILFQLLEVHASLTESVQIKLAGRGALA